ncbi:MAG: hypothetical protein Q7T91_12030, partial [Sulfuricurvum sp.]|nr:hypothetical protein [Sulfuricurvum sp.]
MMNVLVLLTLFLSGLFLWEGIDLEWESRRWLLLIHVPLALSLIGYYAVTYIVPHVRYHLRPNLIKHDAPVILGLDPGIHPQHLRALDSRLRGNDGVLTKRKNSFKRTTGMVLGFAILVSLISGLWLMLIGQRGEPIGVIAQFLHLSSSFVIVLLLLF